ncbi:MAG: radical SAM protein [Candidatus Bathyarchaeia archaeon]
MGNGGYKIVLTAGRTLMSEYHNAVFLGFSACCPRGFMPDEIFFTYLCPSVKVNEDGSVDYAQLGTRKIEAALINYGFKPEDIIVAHPDHLDKVIGPNTKVIGLTEHDPLGLGPPTSTFIGVVGGVPYNAYKFRELLNHPAIKEYRSRLKIILGGGGAWQFKDEAVRRELGIDTVVIGEGEKVVGPLFEKAIRGEELPGLIRGEVVPTEEIPTIRKATICGIVEVARGCGRGCDFCIPDMLRYRVIPIGQILNEVDVNLRWGRQPLLHAEDILRYGAKGLNVNREAVIRLFKDVRSYPGVNKVSISHFCLSSVASAPDVVEEIERILDLGNPEGQLWLSGQTGIETGSPRLVRKHMRGKAKPFEPEEYPDTVVKAFEILSQHHWIPCSTVLIGLPGETDEDAEATIKLVHRLRDFKSLIVPMFAVSSENPSESFIADKLTEMQGEVFLSCWEHDLRWSQLLLDEYIRAADAATAEGIKSILAFTVSLVTEWLNRCRNEYHCNIPAMIRDFRESLGQGGKA